MMGFRGVMFSAASSRRLPSCIPSTYRTIISVKWSSPRNSRYSAIPVLAPFPQPMKRLKPTPLYLPQSSNWTPRFPLCEMKPTLPVGG